MRFRLKSKLQIRHLFVLGALFLFFDAESQEREPQNTMGRLVGGNPKKPVAYGMVMNKSLNLSAMTDSSGYFSIRAKMGDTLVFSRIGFYPKEMLSFPGFHVVELTERQYELNAVTINGLGTYEEFKYNVIHAQLPKTLEINPEIMKSFPKKVVVLQPQMSIPLGSPVTALYMMLSKEGKSLRKLAELQKNEKVVASYSYKYSPAIVSRLTGLKELELEKFIKYCNFDENFILASNEYEIAQKILDCYKKYKLEGTINPPDSIQ